MFFNLFVFFFAINIIFFSHQQNTPDTDWLITPFEKPVTFSPFYVEDGCLEGYVCYSLSNGLISRKFLLSKQNGWVTMDLYSHMRDESSIRAISDEGTVVLNGILYYIGGVNQTYDYQAAYWNETDLQGGGLYERDRSISFVFVNHTTSFPVAPFQWTPGTRHSPKSANWPPLGLRLTVSFLCPFVRNVLIQIHYEMYQGIPVTSKWISIHTGNSDNIKSNHRFEDLRGHYYTPKTKSRLNTGTTIVVDSLEVENLSPTREYSNQAVLSPLLTAVTDQAHGSHVTWGTDPRSSRSPGAYEPTISSGYTLGPGVFLDSRGADFVSFRVILSMFDSPNDLQRISLSRRKINRVLTPQRLEAPLFFHLSNSTPGYLMNAVDQLSEVGGFDMLIFSFGSGFKMETFDKKYITQISQEVEYAKSKGIEVGGYDLICLDRGYKGYGGNVNKSWDRILEDGNLGVDACFATRWVDKLHEYINEFLTAGLTMIETDGPYGGAPCYSEKHLYHMGYEDSVYHQERIQGQLYGEMISKGVFTNVPDYYFFAGQNKAPMGYAEFQFSLPRWEDLTITRQNVVYDDTIFKVPSEGCSFVPISIYHKWRFHEESEFLPLGKHLKSYEFALAQHIGAGIAACYRGPVIFDDDESKEVVKKWTSFWVQYRRLLQSDIIHLRRASGRGFDAFMHVNGETKEALVMVFNGQMERSVKGKEVKVELYYSGIWETAMVQKEGVDTPVKMEVERDYSITLNVDLEPLSLTWWYISEDTKN